MSTFYNSNNKVFAETSGLTSESITDLKSKILLPAGSALMTSAGKLSPEITAIFHAATGTMNPYFPEQTYYEPTLQSVEDSIKACFELGKLNGNKLMAMPYIGGKIFKKRIFKGQGLSDDDQNKRLVACIVAATINNAKSSALDYCFVAFDHPTYILFSDELENSFEEVDLSAHLKEGDITDFKLHNCDGIVNAANMEVKFGGGISGAIANGTQNQSNIDQEARAAINKFWTEYISSL
ncbi:MAG: hypothetical protein IPI60_15265 [Saprospiraceae bacterium]|nr:hypothetical protein [Saprospiraceae bacterium]